MDDPRDQDDRDITGCFKLSSIKNKESILQCTLQYQSFLGLSWFGSLGLMAKKVKGSASRFVLKTRALKRYQYKKSEALKNNVFNGLFDGIVMENKYKCIYEYNNNKSKSVGDSKLIDTSRYLYWESDIWTLPPNMVIAAYCEGTESTLAQELMFFAKRGFPTFSGEFYRVSMVFWAYKNTEEFHKSGFRKFMGMHMQQLGVHLKAFFECQTNRDLIFKTTKHGQLKMKNILKIKFEDYILYPIQMGVQLLVGAARRNKSGNEKKYATIYLPNPTLPTYLPTYQT